MSIDINSIVILNIHSFGYCCIIVEISNSEATNLLRNADLSKSSGPLWNIKDLLSCVERL